MTAKTTEHYISPGEAKANARAGLLPLHVTHRDGHWDSFVRLMRRTLPFVAVILGGLTAFWPLLNSTEVSFTLSKDDVASSDGKVRMTNLKYVGTDEINRLFKVTAASGLQDDPANPRIKLTNIQAEMDIEPGIPAFARARTGIYRMKEGSLSLIGGVFVETANGYKLNMAGAEVDLHSKVAVGQGSINGLSPIGTLKAGRMELFVSERTGIFGGGIQLHITPKRPASKAALEAGDENRI